MKKGLLALICLSMLAVAPACKQKEKKPAKPKTTMKYDTKKPVVVKKAPVVVKKKAPVVVKKTPAVVKKTKAKAKVKK